MAAYSTDQDSNAPDQSATQPEVTEKIGGAEGIRTLNLLDAIGADDDDSEWQKVPQVPSLV